MDFSGFMRLMGLATLLAWVGWFFVLFRIDLEETAIVGFILFYSTLYLASVGTLTTVGTFFRVKFGHRKDVLVSREVRISFRHAVILSCAGIGSLVLASQGLLTWWNFLGLFVLVGFVEYLFLLLQEGRR